MAIIDGTDQTRVTFPRERPAQPRLPRGHDGNDSGISTNIRQHDNEAPAGPGHSHEADTAVNEGQSSEDLTLPVSEAAHGRDGCGQQTRREGTMPNDGQSANDTIADRNKPPQTKALDEPDLTTLPGSARGSDRAGLSLASLRKGLQCIREYRTSAFNKDKAPYFELQCLMQDGQWYWIAESDIQRSVPSAVGTFWGCGPEDWVAPEAGGKETGHEVWKRPLATDDDGVPDAFLIMSRKSSQSGQTGFLVQKVGYPATQPIWYGEKMVKEKWNYEYQRYRSNNSDYHDVPDGDERHLVAIVGHRLNGENGSQKRIQLSCQWSDDSETWGNEDETHKQYNAAVLTYWQSDPKARRACKVPDQRLRIVSYEEAGGQLLLKVQMVGRSCCDGCMVCGDLPCQQSSVCTPNVPLEPVGRLLRTWPDTTEKYLEDQDLSCYTTKSRVKRRSERLQCCGD